jgi:hypothetical protein
MFAITRRRYFNDFHHLLPDPGSSGLNDSNNISWRVMICCLTHRWCDGLAMSTAEVNQWDAEKRQNWYKRLRYVKICDTQKVGSIQ